MATHPPPGAPSNRLAAARSPYLLLHRFNPVDWYEWGEEALDKARREEKPIFLSVGYSTCYWCHVMERESFSNAVTAERMNRDFVNIKLDREERPELDEIYMTATQLLTGQGGWPNSVFLTPDLKPFFAGTYFPPEGSHGRPGFRALLEAIATAWRTRRPELLTQADEFAEAIRRFLEERSQAGSRPTDPETAQRSFAALARRFDATWGGFGSAPKFPTPSNLFLLLELSGERAEAGQMLAATLDGMLRGGIYDQLGGGFHRYATDREWKIPHFEKMLYDNGLLLELVACEHGRTGEPEMARVARETADFLGREMTSPEGAFWSAIDAETAGDEGAFYVWRRGEIDAVLGAEDAQFLAPLYGFDRPPFFEGDRYVLHLPRPVAAQAAARRTPREELWAQMAPLRARLFEARAARERPATDDKVLAEWNGMAISGLATAGRLLGIPDLVRRAERAAAFVLEALRPGREGGSELRRSWRAGSAGETAAFLADYAYLGRGLLAVHEASGEPRWLEAAASLAREQRRRLGDADGGYFTAAESADVLVRSKEVFDGAVPSANAVAVLNLLDLAERTGAAEWGEEAERALRSSAEIVELQVEAARMMTIAARRFAQRAGAAAPALDTPSVGSLDAEARRLVETELRVEPPGEGAWQPFELRLTIAPGWHIQSHSAPADLVATALEGEGCELRGVRYPDGVFWRGVGRDDVLSVYEDAVSIGGQLRRDAPRPVLRLTCQPCDPVRCLPAVTLEVPVP